MSMRFKGGVISATAPTTSTSAASGIWTLPQQLQAKAASNWPVFIPAIGAAYEGGFFAGQIGVSGVATHNLVVGPVASAENASKQWKTANTTTTGTSSVIDGPANSTAMNDASHPAAQFCEGLTIGGFSDWYMPAQNELEVCYYNLKPITSLNNTASGTNPNAVPARASNYTTANPARTSSTAFQSTGTEYFASGVYWASTQTIYASFSRYQRFDDGTQYNATKTSSYRVRAIRRVAV